MTDHLEPKAARTSVTEEELQRALADIARDDGHQRAEAMAGEISILRQALQSVRSVASDALADVAPERTIMVIAEDTEIVACCPVSDVVAHDHDKKRSIRELGSQFHLSVDFVKINCRTFTSVEACKKFLRDLSGQDEDLPFTT